MTAEAKRVVTRVSEALEVTPRDIFSHRRPQDIVDARWLCWYALWLRGYTMSEIGKWWSRDHTGVSYAIGKVRFYIKSGDNTFKHKVDAVGSLLDVSAFRYRYEVDMSGKAIVLCAHQLTEASLKERAIVEIERGLVTMNVENVEEVEAA